MPNILLIIIIVRYILFLDFFSQISLRLSFPFPLTHTVKPLYNDTTYLADRIVRLRVSLYSVFIYKMHQKSKLGNDIIYLHL